VTAIEEDRLAAAQKIEAVTDSDAPPKAGATAALNRAALNFGETRGRKAAASLHESRVSRELHLLEERVRACTLCDLHTTALKGVPGEGPEDAKVMLVGEAPGFNEDREGRPFVGAAGKFLDELLAVAGLTRDEVYITNVVKHRPPSNRDPLPEELSACRVHLDQQVEIINPQVIVTLGRVSLGTFFPGSSISRLHGQIRQKEGRAFFHCYHPAAALYQHSLRDTLMSDMKVLAEYLRRMPENIAESTEDAPHDEDAPEQLSLW
jgi:uracil-DNA glycosylase